MRDLWIHKKTIFDGEKYEIDGINIWDFNWERTDEKIKIKDPLYSQDFIFEVFKIQKDNSDILFAAGEFSNCVWGIYQKENIEIEQENRGIKK
ncbi:hypothetical protein ACHRVZ_09050 [Flavobacterium sp. FlaQc-57]|uniref:hypothetical protein n=1 Tax=Flavobacterium sp. FlaQc-57 TaxID=3374186 RepID=UPI0037575843